MSKRVILFSILVFFCAANAFAIMAPIQFDMTDVYSSARAYYRFADGSDSDSYYQVTHGATTTTLDAAFNIDIVSGHQYGIISAFPNEGKVTATGNSQTVVTPMDLGTSGFEGNRFWSWGKHVVIGSFMVPHVGASLTEVFLDIALHETDGAVALIRMEGFGDEPTWDPNAFPPDDYTSWYGFDLDQTLALQYAPGNTIHFAFAIEPGISGHGRFSNGLVDNDSVSATYRLYYDAPTSVIPEPATLALFGFSLLGAGLFRKKSRR